MALSKPSVDVGMFPVNISAGLDAGTYKAQNGGEVRVYVMTTDSAVAPTADQREKRRYAKPGKNFDLIVNAGQFDWAWTEFGQSYVAID